MTSEDDNVGDKSLLLTCDTAFVVLNTPIHWRYSDMVFVVTSMRNLN